MDTHVTVAICTVSYHGHTRTRSNPRRQLPWLHTRAYNNVSRQLPWLHTRACTQMCHFMLQHVLTGCYGDTGISRYSV